MFKRMESLSLLHIDDITWLNLLILGNTLDRQTNRISWRCFLKLLLVLLNGENLLVPQATGHNSNDITGAKGSLLNSTADDLTNSLNVGDGETNRKFGVTLGGLDEVVERFHHRESGHLFLGGDVGTPSLVPGCLVRLVNKVITMEPRVGDERDLLRLEADQLKHLLEFVLDLIEATLVPVAGIHLVDANNDLIHTKKVEETSMLTRLALLHSGLGISLGNGSLETTLLRRHKKKSNIRSGKSSDHVLDVILVAGGIDNRVVVLVSEEFLGITLNGHTALAFLLARQIQ